jgi:hypothetical protein
MSNPPFIQKRTHKQIKTYFHFCLILLNYKSLHNKSFFIILFQKQNNTHHTIKVKIKKACAKIFNYSVILLHHDFIIFIYILYIFAFRLLFIFANFHKNIPSNEIHNPSYLSQEKKTRIRSLVNFASFGMVGETYSTHTIGPLCNPSSLTKILSKSHSFYYILASS